MSAKSQALVEYASKKEVIKRGSEFILPINCDDIASAVLHWHFSCGKNHADFFFRINHNTLFLLLLMQTRLIPSCHNVSDGDISFGVIFEPKSGMPQQTIVQEGLQYSNNCMITVSNHVITIWLFEFHEKNPIIRRKFMHSFTTILWQGYAKLPG